MPTIHQNQAYNHIVKDDFIKWKSKEDIKSSMIFWDAQTPYRVLYFDDDNTVFIYTPKGTAMRGSSCAIRPVQPIHTPGAWCSLEDLDRAIVCDEEGNPLWEPPIG